MRDPEKWTPVFGKITHKQVVRDPESGHRFSEKITHKQEAGVADLTRARAAKGYEHEWQKAAKPQLYASRNCMNELIRGCLRCHL